MEQSQEKLSFGLMCNGFSFSNWQVECLERLLEIDEVNLELLIIDEREIDSSLTGKIHTLNDYRKKAGMSAAINKAAWYFYRKPFDEPACMKHRDLTGRFDGVDHISCSVREEGFSQYFYDEDIQSIRQYELDFIIRFGFGIIRGEILDVPKYGIWSFHHNDERKYRGGPACFWQVYDGESTTGAMLQRLTDRLDGGVILKRGIFPTNQYSYAENLNHVYYGTTEWPAQVATDILNDTADYLNDSHSTTNAPIYRSPSPLQLARYTARRFYRLGNDGFRGINNWNVGILKGQIENLVSGSEPVKPSVSWLSEPLGNGFIADPFPLNWNDRTYIFFEEYQYQESKGKISYIAFSENQAVNPQIKVAHEEPFHMSYPYIFTHDQGVYGIPETYEANEIRLYNVSPPDNWTHETTLIDGVKAVDPTIIHHDDQWWLFFTEKPYTNSKLHIWYAPELKGNWIPHQNNPVKTDVRSSRPGGTPFTVDGSLYRPAQYCADDYGQKIVINRVEELSPVSFSETKVCELSPGTKSNYSEGLHTLSHADGLTVIDGKRRIKNKYMIKRRLNQLKYFAS